MRIFVRRYAAAFVSIAILLAPACAKRPVGSDPVAPTLTLEGFIEEGDLVALIAGTKVTRLRDGEPFLPLEIALVNKGMGELTITRESFTLVDDQGSNYGVVGPAELTQNNVNLTADRRLGALEPVLMNRYQPGFYTQLPSLLTPANYTQPLPDPRMHIPRYNWIHDIIYFPMPEGGVRGKRFDLLLTSPEIEDPIVLTFEVR